METKSFSFGFSQIEIENEVTRKILIITLFLGDHLESQSFWMHSDKKANINVMDWILFIYLFHSCLKFGDFNDIIVIFMTHVLGTIVNSEVL